MTRIQSNPPPGLSTGPQPKHTVGETKTEGGKTYRLNRNWRWERADDDENDASWEGEPPPVQADISHEQRHAVVAANLKTVPKPLAGVIRSLHESPEYKAGNAVTSMNLHPDVHGKLYANLKQNVGTEMSGGRVVDFGGGRIGFASRAGSLVLWQNGRVAYTNQTGIIDKEAISGKNLASVDSSEGDIIQTADESELDTPATRAAGATAEEAALAKHGINKLPTRPAKELRDEQIKQLDARNKRQPPELLDKPLQPATPKHTQPPTAPQAEAKPPIDHAKRAAEIAASHEGDGWDLLKTHAKEFAEHPELVDHVRQAFEAKEAAAQPGQVEPEAAESALQSAVDTSPPAEATPQAVEPKQAEQALAAKVSNMNEAQKAKLEQGFGLEPEWEARATEQIRKMRERRAAKEKQQPAPQGESAADASEQSSEQGPPEPPSYTNPKAKWKHPKWVSTVRDRATGLEITPDEYEHEANRQFEPHAQHQNALRAAYDHAVKSSGLDAKDVQWLNENGYDYSSDPQKIKGKVPRRKSFAERFPNGFGLDDTARSLAGQHESLGWGGGYGSESEGEDLDSKLWELLSQGPPKKPSRLDEEFLKQVDQSIIDAHANAGGGSRPGTEPGDEDWKSVPFQKRRHEDMYPNANAAAKNTDSPTDGQKDSGNYRKGKFRFHGLTVTIETPKGNRRRPEWPPMSVHYGYINKTEGRDGDQVDVFVGPDTESELVVVVDQVSQSGRFDEHKCLIGFTNQDDAIEAYKRSYTADWVVGPVTAMTIEQFKSWLEKGDQMKRIGHQVSEYQRAE